MCFFLQFKLSRYPGRVSIKIKKNIKNTEEYPGSEPSRVSEEKKVKRKSGHLREK